MKKFFLNVLFIFLCLGIFAQSTFRISYDVANFDLAGGMVVTPAGDYVIAGTNASFLPYYGNIIKLDNTGSVLFAKSYTGGIATTFNDIKNVSSGGFIVCGLSSSGGAILLRLDNLGNVTWAYRYLLPNISSSKTSNEFFNSVIETSDGGFLAVGGVDYFWDGVSASTVDTTSFFAVKVNSLGTIQWSRVWTISTPQPDESYFTDCAESSDGYLLVGQSADGTQTMSNGDYPSDAFIIKVDKNTGANIFVQRFGNGNTTSQVINGVITLSNGNFLLGGQDDIHAFVIRLQGTGTSITQQFGRRINGASFPITQYVIQDLMENSDGNYSFIGWRIAGLFPTLNSAILKMNSSTGAIMLGKVYAPVGLSAILPEGGLVPSDQGYFFVNTDQQVTGFNYNVVRTNSNGDIGSSVAQCTNSSISPGTQNYNPTYQAITTNSYNLATSSSFIPLVSTLTPTTSVHCLNCNLSIVPNPTVTPNPVCSGQTATISITNTVSGYNYPVYTSSIGGTSLGNAPLAVSPANTTTYYIEVQSQTNPSCLSATRTPVIVTVNPAPNLTVSANNNPVCSGSVLNLSASGATSYTWSGPGGFSSNSANPSIPNVSFSNAGIYTVVGSAGGCTASSVINISVSPIPTANAGSASSITCSNPTVTLNGSGAGAGGTYTWSGPGIVSGGNSPNPVVNQPGNYTLVVTSSAGCTSTNNAVVSVPINTTPPVPGISFTGSLTCATPTLQLNGSPGSGVSYQWSGPGGFTSTQQNPVVNMPGTYNLTVTSTSNGCSASVSTVVPQNTVVSASASSSGSITCITNTFNLNGNPASMNYTWYPPSGGNIVSGQNSQNAVGQGSGTYTLLVLNPVNGCTAQSTTAPPVNTVQATPNISVSGTITCVSNTFYLSSSTSGVSYTWVPPSGGTILSGQNTSTAIASGAGVYTLQVTNLTNGCTAQNTIAAIVNTTAPSGVNVSPSSLTLACPAQTAILTATASGSGNSFVWTAPPGGSILSGGNSNTVQVTAGGTVVFTVVVTGANGCTTAATSTVSPNTNAPQFNFSTNNPSITCAVSNPTVSVVLTSTVGIQSYSWSPASGIVGPANNSVAVFNQGGVYTVVVTGTNGCITSNTLSVGVNTQSPQMVSGSGTAQAITCSQSVSVINPQFTPSSDLTYTWTGSGIVGSANNSSVTVNQPGVYTVQVTNTLTGCSSGVMTVQVSGNNVPPTLTINMSNTVGLTCYPGGNTVMLTAQSNMTNVIYAWSNGGVGPQVVVNQTGTYSVTVTELTGSCSATGTVNVGGSTVSPIPGVTVSGPIPCWGGMTQLTAVSSPNYTYNWSGPGIVGGSNLSVLTVSAAGIYTVQVTDVQTGCVGTETLSVSQMTVISQFTADPVIGSAPLVVTFTNQSVGRRVIHGILGA